MTIKSTVYIKNVLLDRVKNVADLFDLSISEVINLLIRKSIKCNKFRVKLMISVRYQERCLEDNAWHTQHISFYGDVYEKCHDMRNIFKFSVSFLVAHVIEKYLNQLIDELKKGRESDNYSPHYFVLYSKHGVYSQITKIWDYPGEKKIKKIMENHKKQKTRKKFPMHKAY